MIKHLTIIKLRINWSQPDIFGHVSNVMFYKYIQAARVQFWEQIDLYKQIINEVIAPLLASATIDFKKQMRCSGNVIIQNTFALIKNTSFGLEYSLLNENNKIVALGRDTVVLYDFNKNEKLSISDDLRINIENLKN